jgi:hypothetical protein
MAVNIQEMQVDADDKTTPPQASQQQPKSKAPLNLAMELEMLAERQLRLKGD